MTQIEPPPKWLKEWATVAAKLAAVVLVLWKLLRGLLV